MHCLQVLIITLKFVMAYMVLSEQHKILILHNNTYTVINTIKKYQLQKSKFIVNIN